MQKKAFCKLIQNALRIPLEAPVGFEPTIRVLQTHALPLGYRAILPKHYNKSYLCFQLFYIILNIHFVILQYI